MPDLLPQHDDIAHRKRGQRSQKAAAGEPLFTIEELASQAAVSKSSIRREIASGSLVAVRLGRCVRVRLSDWQHYLDANRIVGGSAPAPAPRSRPVSTQPTRPQ